MALAPSIDPSGIAPVTDPSVVGGAPDASPTTLVLQYLRQRGFTPTTENVRRALEANQRDPGVIPGLRSDRPATEAEDQAAMRAAGVGGGRGGAYQPSGTGGAGDTTLITGGGPGTGGQGPTTPPDRREGSPTTSAAPPGAPPAAPPVASVSPSVAATPQPPASPDSGAPGLGVTIPAIANNILTGTNSVMDVIKNAIAQRPPGPAPAPAPAEPQGPAPVPWVVQALADENRKSNVNPAPGVPTVRSPLQMYGGVPEPNAPLPAPVAPADPTRPMRQQPIPVIKPSVMLSRPPPPLEAALRRALEDRRNQAVDDTQTRGATVATR